MGSIFGVLRSVAAILALGAFAMAAEATTMVRFQTSVGIIDIRLLDAEAPRTTTNFLAYVGRRAYDNTFVHRHARNFVIQGGGYTVPPVAHIPTDPPIQNEYSAARPNVRGTVAMAKTSDPHSATSEWFVNLVDNTSTLDERNAGGFTVFGRVTAPGMATVDAITTLQLVNAGGTFNTLPVRNWTVGQPVLAENLVVVGSARVLPSATDADRVFNWVEAAYPQYAPLEGATSGTFDGYHYRHYPKTNAYIGAKNGEVFYLVPALSSQITRLSSLAELLATAAAAGY